MYKLFMCAPKPKSEL